MLPYTLRQLVWMLTSALQLVYALSTGIVWVMQMLRLFAYGACVGVCFIPHWWWYLTSPNIIRRVSYRSSDTTKKRNILRVLEAEGVDLHEVLRKSSTPPPLPLPAGVRRRRVLAGPRGSSSGNNNNSNNTTGTATPYKTRSGAAGNDDGGSGRRAMTLQRGGRPVPPRRRPLSNAATVAESRGSQQWAGDDFYGSGGGGEVVQAAPSARSHDVASGASSGSYGHRGFYGGVSGALQLHAASADVHGEAETVDGNWGGLSHPLSQSPRHARSARLHAATPPPPSLSHDAARAVVGPASSLTGGPRRRGAARPACETPTSTTLERLMGAAPVHLNPADGSALRSLPVQRPVGQRASGTTGGRGAARGADETRAAQRRTRPSLSPHRTPLTHSKATAPPTVKTSMVEVRQSSSSSCDMTVNRPENSSGEEERGVGGRHAQEAAPASSTPQLRSAAAPARAADGHAEPPSAPVYEGRPVYFDALPKAELPDDPLLKDVLAALQEGGFGDNDHHDAVERSAERLSEVCGGDDGPPHHASPKARPQEGSGERGPRRQLRRSPQQQQQQQHLQQQRSRQSPPQPPPLHTRTFSEENILAGLEEEDEEDKMNLHNRATVDIVLPVPLDSLMKTLEYTQHSKRLRRKRFPIVINVTGAVWIIGSHLWSTMMARVLAQRGYVVFCPDYRNFPQTTMEGMTLDVSDAVGWVLSNAERYNGDLNNVTLIGQSAGAHLTMMSLLSQAQLSAYRSNTLHGTYESEPPPSDVAYNVPRYNPRESIHRYVGLSGMYNIEGLVDHFQREGLNTPVLHQIAGGRDQLPRYSIHAYFDDRRGGDTGEVLPDNIFDYFPQRMFFVHGDADKCAPVTESASLVAMLRSAQARYAVRRSERNEEARRHALRSRRLLSATGAGEEDGQHGHAADDYGDEAVGGSAEYSHHPHHHHNEHSGGGPWPSMSPSILANTAAQQQQHAVPAVFSSIVPPSRDDPPKPPVELEFIVIPNGRHSDAFVDECIAAGRSCCVDFLCDYESAVDFPSSSFAASMGHGLDGDSVCGSVPGLASMAQRGDHIPAWMAQSSEVCAMPDGILPLAVPTEERSLPLRLCTLICPF